MRIGIIGGTGLYDLPGLTGATWKAVTSPFGVPSDELLLGELDGVPVAFLTRHGRRHRLPPSAINYRANIDALKRVGVTDVLSLSAVGSLQDGLEPGTLMVVDQFIDRTVARPWTFFDGGLAMHVPMAHPTCRRLMDVLMAAGQQAGIPLQRGGTYVGIEGPRFSSGAESRLYQSWGADVIGMTNVPEAFLAREAELCYASVAMVTGYDCWRSDGISVTSDELTRVFRANLDRSRAVMSAAVALASERPAECTAGCDRALDGACLTPPESRDAGAVERLRAVAGRVL